MPTVRLLHCSIDADDESVQDIRILVDNKYIKYLTIDPGIYDPDDLVFAPVLNAILEPILPPGLWKKCHVSGDATDGPPLFTPSAELELNGIRTAWHPHCVEYIDLTLMKSLRGNVVQALQVASNETQVAKFARFEWEIPRIEAEIRAYEWIQGHDIAPPFVGNITEEGRVIGFLMGMVVDAQRADPDDIESCREVLGRLHALGIKHGDVNRHNFLAAGKRTWLIDFDGAEKCEDGNILAEEKASLEEQLNETTGRGGVTINGVVQT